MHASNRYRVMSIHACAAICGAICGAFAFACAGPAFAAGVDARANTDAKAVSAPVGAKITSEQASAIALKAVPGKLTGVTVEKKRGKNVYVVEIMSVTSGETDVLVDPVSGKVLGTE